MKKALILFTVILSSCLHKGPIKQESGFVIEKQYCPSFDATGTGFDTKGNISTHTLHENEKYITVFKCEHGIVFSINRSDIYGKLDKGDTVLIDYREMLNNKDEVRDFDFLNANKKH